MNVLKIKYGEDTRRVNFQPGLSFMELCNLIRNCFKINDFSIKYEDDDKDLITISSDLELREAINLISKGVQNNRVLRLFVSVKDNTTTTTTTTTPIQQTNVTSTPVSVSNTNANTNPVTVIPTLNPLASFFPSWFESVVPVRSETAVANGNVNTNNNNELGYGLAGMMQMLQNPIILQMLQNPAIMQIFQNPALIQVLSQPQVMTSLLHSFAQVGGQSTSSSSSSSNGTTSTLPDLSGMLPSLDFNTLLRNFVPNMLPTSNTTTATTSITGTQNQTQTPTPISSPTPQSTTSASSSTYPYFNLNGSNLGDVTSNMFTYLGPILMNAVQNPAIQNAMSTFRNMQEQLQSQTPPPTTTPPTQTQTQSQTQTQNHQS